VTRQRRWAWTALFWVVQWRFGSTAAESLLATLQAFGVRVQLA